MRKRLFALLIGFAMVASLLTFPVFAATTSTRVVDSYVPSSQEATFKIADLMAGQYEDVGDLFIDPLAADNTYLVTYQIDEPGWFITEVHFEAINEGDDAFIYSKGGLIPGKFTVNKSWEISEELTKYSFIYTSGAAVSDFTAHAVVCQPAVYEDVPHNYLISSNTDTLYSTTGTDPWSNAVLAWDHPSWPELDGAEWIWESYQVDEPRLGDTIYFKKDFEIVGTPTAATLTMTADNEYEATVNGLPDPVYSDDDWKVIITYDIKDLLDSGSNTLLIKGVNWAWPTDSVTVNPGAIVYQMVIDTIESVEVSPEICESVWGKGVAVNLENEGGNWSMIIPLPTIDCVEVQTLSVPSTTMAGVLSQTLKDGYGYCLEASGTYKFANWAPPTYSGYADAKFNCREGSYIPDLTGYVAEEDYHVNTDGTVWINGQSFGYVLGLQIRIDGEWANWVGEYNDDHIYTKTLTGTGSKLTFAIYDNVYTDNSGSLTVKICQKSFVW